MARWRGHAAPSGYSPRMTTASHKGLSWRRGQAMLDDAALQRMTLTAYEAATDASRWHVLMEDLQRNFHASTACIFTPVVGASQRLLSAAAGMDASAQALIAEWVPKDPWLQTRLEQRLPMDKGMVVVGS